MGGAPAPPRSARPAAAVVGRGRLRAGSADGSNAAALSKLSFMTISVRGCPLYRGWLLEQQRRMGGPSRLKFPHEYRSSTGPRRLRPARSCSGRLVLLLGPGWLPPESFCHSSLCVWPTFPTPPQLRFGLLRPGL